MSGKVQVDFEGRTLTVTNLGKVLYPESGFTKGDLIDYYAKVAPYLLPHLQGRVITTRRWPNGVNGESFFQKNCPDHKPDWIDTAPGPAHKEPVSYCLIDELAGIVWLANLAAIEIHLPMALAADVEAPTSVVFDLDPGPGTTLAHCSMVALEIQRILSTLKLETVVKTSGQKGMQIYLPVAPTTHDAAAAFARAIGGLVGESLSELITLDMAKAQRPGKIFIDWSQNTLHKTTVGAYSLRPTPSPQVSTPITWDEVSEQSQRTDECLLFSPDQVLDRLASHGDLFKGNLSSSQVLPEL